MIQDSFKPLVDIDVDGGVLQVGLDTQGIGPARPVFRLYTGSLDVYFNIDGGDLDRVIEGLRSAKKKLARP